MSDEKMEILKRDNLTEVEKRFSTNAIRLLAARYLWRDPKTDTYKETVDELFKRVAVNAAIAEIIYDPKVFDRNGGHTDKYERSVAILESLRKHWKEDPTRFRNVYKITDEFPLNEYHFERLLFAYENIAKEGKAKVSIDELLGMLRDNPGQFANAVKYVKKFYEALTNQIIMPNTPALINSGRPLGMLSACFTIDTKDDMESIMDTAKEIAIIAKAGGGIGINLSVLRPSHDAVALSTTGYTSSGIISWLKLFNEVLEQVKQGGVRRGAGMAILEPWHPQIFDFIYAKEKNRGNDVIANFNLSVGTDIDFWEAVYNDAKYPLIAKKQIIEDGEVVGEEQHIVGEVDARNILDEVAKLAWSKGDPAFLFFHNGNAYNIRDHLFGKIKVTNPCGEEYLYPNESCNLASINVEKFVVVDGNTTYFDFDRYAEYVMLMARMLDNFIDVNNLPTDAISNRTRAGRNIGAGIMGLANMLFRMHIPFNSEDGFKLMSRVAEYLTYYTMKESVILAREREPFSYFDKTKYVDGHLPVMGYYDKDSWTLPWDELVAEIKQYGLRNVDHTTSPPTGSVSMIADTSNGIEPLFSLVYKKITSVGTYYYVNPIFEEELKARGIYSPELLEKVVDNYSSVQGLEEIPEDMQKIFVTAIDIHWLDHIVAQIMVQKWLTNSVSKTINMPYSATVDDVKSAFIIAERLGAKGITVYRNGSLEVQVYVSKDDMRKFREQLPPSQYALDIVKRLIDTDARLKPLIGYLVYDADKNPDISFAITLHNIGEHNHTSVDADDPDNIPPGKVKELLGKVYCPVCYEKEGKLVKLHIEAGCSVCPECGWSACIIS